MRAGLAFLVVALAAAAFACSPREEATTAQPTKVATVEPGQAVPWAAIPAPLTPVARPPSSVVPSLHAPSSVSASNVLRYELTLKNTGESAYASQECPVYVAWLQSRSAEPINLAGETLALNCLPAGSLAPGSTARFEMEISIPAAAPAGAWVLAWSFTGPAGRFGPVAEKPVEIRNR